MTAPQRPSKPPLTCDVAIIGAGTAGLAAERSARKMGATTLLIDDRFAGTTCASVGCMPSKLLIVAGRAARAARGAAVFGIRIPAVVVDGRAVLARVRAQRDAFVAATLDSMAQLPEGIKLEATAHFLDQTTLALDDGSQVTAKAIVIATGARPQVPPPFAALGDRVLTHENIFELEELPRSVAVVGAGPVGLELAQALVRLGVDVRVFDAAKALPHVPDPEVAAAVQAILGGELSIHLGVELSVQREGDAAVLSWTGASAGSARFERVLVATGRSPQFASLNLAAAGLAVDEHGTPHFHPATLQCGKAPIFIAGDADGERAVLHEAAAEGGIAGRNAAAFPKVHPAKRHIAFSLMFTDPPVAVLGRSPDADTLIGTASYADQGRAKVEARNVGLARLYADPEEGRLVGAVLVGPGMDHLAHLIAWSIERGDTATALLDLPFYHPTLEEGLKPALREICAAVHAPGSSQRDDAALPGA